MLECGITKKQTDIDDYMERVRREKSYHYSNKSGQSIELVYVQFETWFGGVVVVIVEKKRMEKNRS